MKLKYLVIILAAVLAAGILAGCGEGSSDTGSGSSIQQTEENTIYGEITEIGEDSVTINVGTRQKMEKPKEAENQEQSDSDSADDQQDDQVESGSDEKKQPSVLELTGEEKVVTVTEDTEYETGFPGEPDKSEDDKKELPSPEKEGADDNTMSDSDAEPADEQPKPETEKITFQDLAAGDSVAITLNDDGTAAEIQVISQPGTKNDDESAASDTTDADSLTIAKAAADAAKAVSEELSGSVSENV
ncbi:Uncharacterised protein [uncultured Roseburia sp.]|uniref:Uncharacterized protein n=1 Tax=Brotonthovivens ammoniilytica TaxID=2981725 RepID=A0ABT2TKG7_9FIRM|nr:hypothetical protein [Brotonthovivens ammoniilytica]MCU6762181.1 hypothetical protein [Brotonthovivens ammoniilytica]SCI58027.1 Uncharacterised protein [uncultured Roseburia sp.]